MHRVSFLALLFLIGCAGGGGGGRSSDEPLESVSSRQAPLRVRVLTYNIHHGKGIDGRIDLERIARVIRATNADLVALQEVDRHTRRSGGVDQAAVLAEALGYEHAFVTAIEFDGGQYGEAVLTRVPASAPRGIPLRRRVSEEEDRAAIEIVTQPWGEELDSVRFIGTHLSHESDRTRTQQAVALKTSLESDPIPAILAGDFNCVQGSTPYQLILEGWLDGARKYGGARPTFPSERPERRIDYVFLRPKHRWRVLSAEVIDERVASDHRPLLLELELLPFDGNLWGGIGE